MIAMILHHSDHGQCTESTQASSYLQRADAICGQLKEGTDEKLYPRDNDLQTRCLHSLSETVRTTLQLGLL
jgi:hypothetical protein